MTDADTVRDALESGSYGDLKPALAALDRLVAERDALDETLVNVGKAHGKQKARADAAEAELSRLREERAALATRLRDGAEHGETTEIRAWCLLALGES